MNKILIASGGTGGHLYPAVVLAKNLSDKNCEVFFAVRFGGLAQKILERENIPCVEIPSYPLYGQSLFNVLKGLWLNFFSVFKSIDMLKTVKPDVVIGFGAYVSVPVVLASFLLRIPIFLHEQNPVPGWANRFCALFCRKIAVSFPETQKHFPKKSLLIGNLLRAEIFDQNRSASLKSLGLIEDRKTVLIFGGSAGAKRINQSASQALSTLQEWKQKIQVIHISGSAQETESLKQVYQRNQIRAVVMDYCHSMGECYAAADLALCRAGATTIAELIATRTPAILIPYPHAGQHQNFNASVLTVLGSAFVIPETETLETALAGKLRELLQSSETLEKMRQCYRKFPVDLKQAAEKFIQCLGEGTFIVI